MAIVNKVEQRGHLDRGAIIKFQLLTYCFLRDIMLTEHELTCLCMLAQQGEVELGSFCSAISDQRVYASAQTVRNVVNKFEKKELVVKKGKKKKMVSIHPALQLQTMGNILLDLKFAYVS